MGPFAVSSNGNSVQTAVGPAALLTIKAPMTKLDVTNLVSFQTISVLFNTEPPQPTVSVSTADVQLAQFPHGYSYIPAIWMAWQNSSPAYPPRPSSTGTATTFYDFGDDSAAADIPGVGNATQLSLYARVDSYPFGSTGAFFYVIVDATNVTLYLRKFVLQGASGGGVIPLYIIGTTANLRLYVFTEPATTSTY